MSNESGIPKGYGVFIVKEKESEQVVDTKTDKNLDQDSEEDSDQESYYDSSSDKKGK